MVSEKEIVRYLITFNSPREFKICGLSGYAVHSGNKFKKLLEFKWNVRHKLIASCPLLENS